MPASESQALQPAVFTTVTLPAFGSRNIKIAIVLIERPSTRTGVEFARERNDSALYHPVQFFSQHKIMLSIAIRRTNRFSGQRSQSPVIWQEYNFACRIINSTRDEALRQIVAKFAAIFLGAAMTVKASIAHIEDCRCRRPRSFLNGCQSDTAVG